MEANREKKHNQYINHNHRQMLSLMQCSDDVVTSADLKYVHIRIRSKQQ